MRTAHIGCQQDAANPGFDYRAIIADEGPLRTAAGFRKSQETHQLVGEFRRRLEPLHVAVIRELHGDAAAILATPLRELMLAHTA